MSIRLSRRRVVGIALAAGAAAASGGPYLYRLLKARRLPPGPNVILFVADSLRADRIGRVVNGQEVTPSLNAFARECVNFTDACSAAPWTKASVASILSGQFPQYHLVTRPFLTLPDIPTIPSFFAEGRFFTLGITANPVLAAEIGRPPYGFGYPFLKKPLDDGAPRGEYLSLDPLPGDRFGNGQYTVGHADTPALLSAFWGALRASPYVRRGYPFFAYLHDMRTHKPWMRSRPTPGVTGRFHEKDEGPDAAYKADLAALYDWICPPDKGIPPEDVIRRIVAIYDEAAFLFDRFFGKFLARLKEERLYDKLTLVLTADHGDEFYEHGRLGHAQNLYDTALRVPLLIKHPGIAPRTVGARVTNASVFPTIMELFDSPQLEETTVFSLRPYMTGELPPDKSVYELLASLNDNEKIILPEGFSIIHRPQGYECFNLATDPGEKRPSEPDESLKARFTKATQIAQYLSRKHGLTYITTNLPEMRAEGLRPDGTFDLPEDIRNTLPQDKIDQLKSLGYLH